MSSDCRECRAKLAHCHGTIIHHPRRRSECTEDDCDNPDATPHAFHTDCEAVGCMCAEHGGETGETVALAV